MTIAYVRTSWFTLEDSAGRLFRVSESPEPHVYVVELVDARGATVVCRCRVEPDGRTYYAFEAPWTGNSHEWIDAFKRYADTCVSRVDRTPVVQDHDPHGLERVRRLHPLPGGSPR